MAEQVPAVGNVLSLVERRDWPGLRRFLDPDVHWTTALEEHWHGRDEVVAHLTSDPPPAAPAYHEAKRGLITRWIDAPG
jgi:hypothetical protein